MKTVISALWVLMLLAPVSAWAQAANFPPNAAGVTMGHWHLNPTDLEATKRMFIDMGGTYRKVGLFEIVKFPGVVIHLHLLQGAKPPTGGTVGSIVDHVGFSVKNLDEAMAKWKAAGVPVQAGAHGHGAQALIVTEDGVRIEIVENKDQRFPIQHDHVHFSVPEDQLEPMHAWYTKFFGATPSTSGADKVGDVPGAHLMFSKADGPSAPTRGRALDHIGFDVTNLEAFCKQLDAVGIKHTPILKTDTGSYLSFFTDPWGTYVEVNERPEPL